MDPSLLKQKISAAKSELLLAEAELESAMAALARGGTRADKTIVTETMAAAFAKLRNARKELAALEESLP